jgi:hypothetical protein
MKIEGDSVKQDDISSGRIRKATRIFAAKALKLFSPRAKMAGAISFAMLLRPPLQVWPHPWRLRREILCPKRAVTPIS